MFVTVVLLSVLVAAGLLLLRVAWHWPGWVIFAVLSVATLLNLLFFQSNGVYIGVHIHIDDIASIAFLGISFLLLIRYRKSFPRDVVPCLVLIALAALSFSRGFGTFGLEEAGNTPRLLLSFTTPALAIMLLRPAFRLDVVRLTRWIEWAGLCLSAAALLRWAGLLPTPVEFQDNLREVVRTLPSDEAIIVGQAFIAAIYLQLVERRSAWWWASAGVLGGLCFALQHRSVWVATAAGLAWLALRTFRLLPERWLGFGATAGVALCLIMVAAPTSLVESAHKMATNNVQEVQSEDSTWAWRVEGYNEAIARLLASEPLDILIGPPAGSIATSNGSQASMAIHSRYIDVLAYYGIVGFTVLLLWFGMLARRVGWPAKSLHGRPVSDHVGTVLLEALLLSEMVYLLAYYGTILQGSLLGLIWAAAMQNNISSRTSQERNSKLTACACKPVDAYVQQD